MHIFWGACGTLGWGAILPLLGFEPWLVPQGAPPAPDDRDHGDPPLRGGRHPLRLSEKIPYISPILREAVNPPIYFQYLKSWDPIQAHP